MTITFGVIGLGGLGQMQAELLADMDDVAVVAGVDAVPDARESFAETFGLPTYEDHEAMLAEEAPDAVTIVTPHTLHHEQAMAAMDAGAHVHVEKPLTTTTADAEELIEVAKKRDLVLQVGFQRHFHPGYREIKRLIEEGRIGTPHMASCYLGQDWIADQQSTWRTNPDLSGGGQLIDSGSHLLDALLWTTGTEPATVAAITDTWGHDVDVNSAISATLERDDGQVVASIGVTGDGHTFEESLTIWGTEGRITYESGELVVEADNSPTYTAEVQGGGYRELTGTKLRAFVDAIREETEAAVPAECGLYVTRLTEAAFEAAKRGETVDAREL